MSHKGHSVATLYQRLREGVASEQTEAARDILARLRERVGAQGEQSRVEGHSCSFELHHIRLRGASHVAGLALGAKMDVEQTVENFWNERGGAGRIGIILTANAELKEQARRCLHQERCIFLDDVEGRILLEEAHHPQDYFKEQLRAQIPIGRLIPYDITRPAEPNMFFGRRDLLKRVLHEETTSFAIAGPGRIGKSSFLHQFFRLCRSEGRRNRIFMIDCFPYSQLPSDELAQRFALDISANTEAYRVNGSSLLRFLRRETRDGDQPLDLLFDEVDKICEDSAFEVVGDAVKHGYCRVVLCGKGGLLRMMTHGTAQLAERLTLVQPEPLDVDSARRLLIEPLFDLGFKIPDAVWLAEAVFGLTQRRPHLIQACARQMIGNAMAEESTTIGQAQFDNVLRNFGAFATTLLPLDAMSDDETRLAALLLLRVGLGEVNVGRLQGVFNALDLEVTAVRALDICRDLWICNVLTWEKDTFAVTNRYLVDHAKRMDLGYEIERLRKGLKKSDTGTR